VVNSKNLRILAIIIAALLLVYFLTDNGSDSGTGGDSFIPGLKADLNSTSGLAVRSGKAAFTVSRVDDAWVIVERGNYPANVGVLRELLIALADATIVETKTSNPDKYHLLGVDDPGAEDSEAIELIIRGEEFEHTVVLGKTAQRNYRYARLAENEQSVLIDKNPDVADDLGGWLVQDLLDVAASRIASVTIEHADGERIEILKESADTTDYTVANIPEGRELSYATVANGIAGTLAGLQLEDVRPANAESAPTAVTVFESFDGLTLSVASYGSDEETWIAISARADVSSSGEEATAEVTGSEAEPDAAEDTHLSAAAEAAAINERAASWQFHIPDYKANLLKRRFEDILKTEEAAATSP